MVMRRWDPFREALSLRDAMDRLFEQAILQPAGELEGRVRQGSLAPPLDVAETAGEYTVKASLPGVKPEDIDIQIHQGELAISGEFREEEPVAATEQGRSRYHLRERHQGRFYRAVSLPGTINTEKATATFEHGVLTLNIPKVESAQARRIPIQSGGATGSGTSVPAASSEQGRPAPATTAEKDHAVKHAQDRAELRRIVSNEQTMLADVQRMGATWERQASLAHEIDAWKRRLHALEATP